MRTFLEETLSSILDKHEDIAALTLILPSKRAGGFLKHHLRGMMRNTTFAPRIISIEDFIEELSDLKIIAPEKLLFKSYDAYLNTPSIVTKEPFEQYCTWIRTLLNDFNELDRYLVDPGKFFQYLSDIKRMERWQVREGTSEFIENYLAFWNSLEMFYEQLKADLLDEGLGYQGMVYRKAAEDMEHYMAALGNHKHIFIGFNALNNAEQHIIQELLEAGKAQVYWDADRYYFERAEHPAGHFLRQYATSWKYYNQNRFPDFPDYFSRPKSIEFIEVQKNVGQAKSVGNILKDYDDVQLDKTAIVLADENLLIPLLYSLPENIKLANVTMGAPLSAFPATEFFISLLHMQQNSSGDWYYKDVLRLLQHPMGRRLIPGADHILEVMSENNITYCDMHTLAALAPEDSEQTIRLLFGKWNRSGNEALTACIEVISIARKEHDEKMIERIVLYELHQLFTELQTLHSQYTHLKDVGTVLQLFREIVSQKSLDFQGDAYSGLQIMGVLETRVLDFDHVIMCSVNEGILPSGKTNNSFITYDLKTTFHLPKYAEKDAIYTYHFYRLLQRASEVTLIYNAHSEGINPGEKSRFLRQLEIDARPQHTIEHKVLSPLQSMRAKVLQQVDKNSDVINRIREIAGNGFSPSALTTYIRNPMDFYTQRVLRVNETETVEETVDYNTLGTIVHDTLQMFYEPLQGKELTREALKAMLDKTEEEVANQFRKTYKQGNFRKGKNLIIFEVAKRYIQNLIKFDLQDLNDGQKIEIVKIEVDLTVALDIPELDFRVHLRGKVDRVDRYNDTLRIIDYKTGRVDKNDLKLKDWDALISEYDYSKAFQVLCYALMLHAEDSFDAAEAGIISFKNLGTGFLKFQDSTGSEHTTINKELLKTFQNVLKKLILEICDPQIPFTEKEIET